MNELRKKAKERGLKGWSGMNKPQLQRFVEAGLRPNQVSVGTQPKGSCNDCGLQSYIQHLTFRAAAVGIHKQIISEQEVIKAEEKAIRKKIIVHDDGKLIDSVTGEVLDYE